MLGEDPIGPVELPATLRAGKVGLDGGVVAWVWAAACCAAETACAAYSTGAAGPVEMPSSTSLPLTSDMFSAVSPESSSR